MSGFEAKAPTFPLNISTAIHPNDPSRIFYKDMCRAWWCSQSRLTCSPFLDPFGMLDFC